MSKLKTLLAGTTLAIASIGAFAQADAAVSTPRVDQRQANQAQRIEQGQASGQLTPRETRRLHRQQHAIAHAETQAKADGTVTPQERHRLHRAQKHASHHIAGQKHDAQTTAQ